MLPCVFFFNDTATTEIYTLSLHDALPIWTEVELERGVADRRRPAADPVVPLEDGDVAAAACEEHRAGEAAGTGADDRHVDRKSTRLNSSHANISYAVFCLKKKTTTKVLQH